MNKTIKKVSIVAALVAVTTLSVPLAAPQSVFALPGSCQQVANYSISQFKTTGTVGEEYVFGAPTGAVLEKVKNPIGVDITTSVISNKFTPTLEGTYTAVFKDTTNNTTSEFHFLIKGVTDVATISLPINSQQILPAKVGQNTLVRLPNAIIQDADGQTIALEDLAAHGLTMKITVNGTVVTNNEFSVPATLDGKKLYNIRYELKKGNSIIASKDVQVVATPNYVAPNYEYSWLSSKPTTAEIGNTITLPGVKGINKDNTDETVAVSYQVTVKRDGQDVSAAVLKTNKFGEVEFTANAKGNFEVSYQIKDFFDKEPTNKNSASFTISNVEDRTAPTPYVAMPYSASVTDKTFENAIEAFEEVQANADVVILPIYATDNANGLVADNLTLKRQIFFGNDKIYEEEDQTAVGKALVFNPSSPTLSSVNVFLNGEVRTITDLKVIPNPESGNMLTAGDTYTVKYIAKDKLSGLDEMVMSLSLKVVNAIPTDVQAPVVSYDKAVKFPTKMSAGETFKFAKPTATQETSSTYFASHVGTYLKTQLKTSGTWGAEGTSWLTYDQEKKEYKLAVPTGAEIANVEAVRVIAYARNNAAKIGSLEKEIKILGTSTDVAAPVTGVVNLTVCDDAMVNTQVQLPEVTYTDEDIANVNVSVLIKDANGAECYAQNLKKEITASGLKIKNTFFVPENAGAYAVTYIATDANGNSNVLEFNLDVASNPSTYDAYFVNLPAEIGANNVVEVGEEIKLPDIQTVVTDSTVLEAGPCRVQTSGEVAATIGVDNTFIKFNRTGTNYTVQFVADIIVKPGQTFTVDSVTYNEGDVFKTLESKVYTVVVKDTKGPQISSTVIENIKSAFEALKADGPLSLESGTVTIQFGFEDGMIPLPTGQDIDYSKSKLQINKSGSGVTYQTYTLNAEGMADLQTGVTFTKDGTYEFVFVLSDGLNTTTLQTFSVDVGDVEPPVLNIASGVINKNYKVGEIINLDVAKITATDMIQGVTKDLIKKEGEKYKLTSDIGTGNIKATLKNKTTAQTYTKTITQSDAEIKFTFDNDDNMTAGEYTLEISITDASGKTTTNTTNSFTISENAGSVVTGEEVLGVVLIVVSVLMLGGVITYFVVTRKRAK